MADTLAIIIFGAAVRPDGEPSSTLRRRVEAAVAFGRHWPEALYVPTGAVGRHGPSEASVMAGLLEEAGIDAGQIRCEDTGTDTLSSVLACVRLLREGSHRGQVFAATSAYHLPRCLLLLRLAGIPARACPPPPAPAARRLVKRWVWRLREVPALPWDAMLLVGLRLAGRL